MILRLIELPRNAKRAISLAADLLLLPLTMWTALSLRLDEFYIPDARVTSVIALTTLITISIFVKLGLYRAVIRYLGQQVIIAIAVGVGVSVMAFATFGFMFQAAIPRSVPLIYFALAMITVGGGRMLMRALLNSPIRGGNERVIIYGAGSAGIQLATALAQGVEYHPIAYVDDDGRKQGTIVNGLRVYKPKSIQRLVKEKGATQILLAISGISPADRTRIISQLGELEIKLQIVPGFADLVAGKSIAEQLREVEIDDLLGRDSVLPDPQLLAQNIKGKSVLVTGAGGSIGSELARQIVKLNPERLVLFEMSEFALYSIEQELRSLNTGLQLIFILGTVQDEKHLFEVMKRFEIETVFHAAAYKHVPLVEHNLVMGVRNNIFGTLYAARAAIDAGVNNFTLISTDKAVRPTSLMGATKRFAEQILQSFAADGNGTNFGMVRFGNVLGSSGSVVPLFKHQITKGGPVTVTHPEITRYFMTIPEAVQLVLQAGAMSTGGDVFVLDMGEPVKILKLAETMIHLMGKRVKGDMQSEDEIEIIFTGLRPGEKLYEELLIGDNCVGTHHPMITRANEHCLSKDQLLGLIASLEDSCNSFHLEEMLETIRLAVPEYQNSAQIVDHLSRRGSKPGKVVDLKTRGS